ncbi:putative C6 transcription factor [Aspergillus steynii IBT 23096]|uniref:Putative C6 transcription factor n=1 Tax=Aspergillus steynii IBT 23096 TaxID=1392250 RepID=A0A2I2GSM1_9EURO|nr:putative C6 transcription factor [Aspergillus steynii IBT 23096]PLB55873.1 putative C6 transcription factor [Aspergillus steynii IBT 23096]
MACIPTRSHPAHITESFVGFYLPTLVDQDSPVRAFLQEKPASIDKQQRLKRPHRKSRRGCLNCKARKVKCQETRPACANCVTRDMDCRYSSKVEDRRTRQELTSSRADHQESLQLPSVSMAVFESAFTGNDLRFFHHFLRVARPHLPFGSEQSWTTEVPAYAHECPHLMHAILSLGATHYALITPNGSHYTPIAIVHRGRALQLLGRALSKGDSCSDVEMDGILATCYTLVFQAYYMTDGLVDFAVMVRGCATVTNQIRARYKKSQMFTLQSQEEVSTMVGSWLPTEAPMSTQANLVASIQDLEKLRPLLQSPAHRTFFEAIHQTYLALQHSPQEAFFWLTKIYEVWYDMENLEFMTFIAPGNYVSCALFMHYIAVEVLMRPLLDYTGRGRDMSYPFGTVLVHQWANTIYHKLPMSMRRLVKGQAELIASDKDTSCGFPSPRAESH